MFCAILSIKFRLESVINCFGPLPPAAARRWNISSSESGSICMWQGRRPGPEHHNCSQVCVCLCVCVCVFEETLGVCVIWLAPQITIVADRVGRWCAHPSLHSFQEVGWRTQIDNKRQRMGKLLGRTTSSVSLSLWVEGNHAGLTFPLRPLLGASRHHGFG